MKSLDDLRVLETISIEQARRSFWAFCQFIDPTMLLGWWQRDAAAHLQQFAEDLIAGLRPSLIIQAPPQMGKSSLIINFMIWMAGKYPELRTIFASYSETLGNRANKALQRGFETERFQRAFPELRLGAWGANNSGFGQAQRNLSMLEFAGTGGYFRNTTVGGAITGESLDLGVIDDPFKGREEANSQVVRDKVWAWFLDDYMTRFSRKSGLLCILTRWHVDDLVARLVVADPSVKVISYPAIAEGDDRSEADRINRKQGEALFPELKDLEQLESQRLKMDPGSWASLYQQRPIVAGGNLFAIDDFKRHRHGETRPYKRRAIYADTAQKTGEKNDFSVFQCWGLGKDGVIYLIDQARGKFEAPELEKVARAFWKKHKAMKGEDLGYLIAFKVEDKVSGTGLIQQLGRGTDSIPIEPIKRSTDKYSRGLDAHPSIAAGLVSIPADAPWTKDLLAELAAFPAGAHDDVVDPLMDAISDLLLGFSYDWGNMEGLARVMGGDIHDQFRQRRMGGAQW